MKKGFTIIELMAVIIIIAIIMMIVVINVNNNINKSKNKTYDILVNSIEKATENYITDNSDLYSNINTPGVVIYVTLQELVDAGYLEEPIKNPLTNENIILTSQVEITVIDVGNIDIEFID